MDVLFNKASRNRIDSKSDSVVSTEIEAITDEDLLEPRVTHMQVLIYVPNLVDYFRYFLVMVGMSYAFTEEKWLYFIWFYYVAISMDVIDGALARILNQTSRFGQCLDMVCDRASVSMIYFILGQVYQELEHVLIFFFLLDYGSHFLQFNANAITKNTSHKNMSDPNENFLVSLYYGNKFFFVLLACGADNGLVIAFVNGRHPEMRESLIWNLLVIISSIIIVLKQIVNVGQCIGSVKKLKKYDRDYRVKKDI